VGRLPQHQSENNSSALTGTQSIKVIKVLGNISRVIKSQLINDVYGKLKPFFSSDLYLCSLNCSVGAKKINQKNRVSVEWKQKRKNCKINPKKFQKIPQTKIGQCGQGQVFSSFSKSFFKSFLFEF
jgi:hypothetical protein